MFRNVPHPPLLSLTIDGLAAEGDTDGEAGEGTQGVYKRHLGGCCCCCCFGGGGLCGGNVRGSERCTGVLP